MTYCVLIVPSAQKEIAALPATVRARVDRRVRALADNPRPHGVIAMKGHEKGYYRLRVGDYRIIYRVHDDVLIVVIVRARHRGEAYR